MTRMEEEGEAWGPVSEIAAVAMLPRNDVREGMTKEGAAVDVGGGRGTALW